jgi:hypothetical protein
LLTIPRIAAEYRLMKYLLVALVLSFVRYAYCSPGDAASFYIGDPIPLYKPTDIEVKKRFPSARLLFISTFAQSDSDPKCSQFGWEFTYQDDLNHQLVSRLFRQVAHRHGCDYLPDSELELDKKDYPPVGISPLEDKIDLVKIPFLSALSTAKAFIGNGFYPWRVQLASWVIPVSAGRVFWSFTGPVSCNKGAGAPIDATSGAFEPKLATTPVCP